MKRIMTPSTLCPLTPGLYSLLVSISCFGEMRKMELFLNLLKKKKKGFGFFSSCVQGFVAVFLLPTHAPPHMRGSRDRVGAASG